VPITLGYGVFASAWAMLPLFVVEGIAQALGVPAAQSLVAAAAPAGRSSAAQGLAGAINQAAAATVAFASPVAYGWWGGDGTFIATAVLVLLVTLAALALQRTAPRADTDDVLVS
jgi:sugar phosphate permease